MEDYLKINQKVYDELAEEYKERRKDYIISDKKLTINFFVKYLKKYFKSARVIDIGPGSGLNLSQFDEEGFETFAIDISQKIIDVAKEVSPNTKFIHSDFLSHDFKDLEFEGIFAKAFIHLFPKKDVDKVFKKIKGLLAPNGIMFIATTLHDFSEESYFTKEDYGKKLKRFRRRWTEEELIESLENIKLKIVHKHYREEKSRGKLWVSICAIRK